MAEKANIPVTMYLTESMANEIDRQKVIYSKGVFSHHARKCIEFGIKHFQELEKNQTNVDNGKEENKPPGE